jgi:N6-adenosine-specific RNA methylase IME4
MLADASEIHLRAERQLGILLAKAKEAGQIAEGRPRKPAENCTDTEQFPRVTLADAGIDRKLSSKAQKAASLPEEAFESIVERVRDRITSGAALIVDKELTTQDKRERRETRERVLGGIQQALPQRKYGVIVADPEWRFEPWSRETGMDRAADNHYPTSCTEVIAARDVPSIAADDCVLFLWATVPMLPHALLVMAAWGFDYKSHVVWIKERPGNARGTGYWFINEHELLLVGTRGKIPAPAPGTQEISVFHAPVGEHSAKPELALRMIEEYFPTLPKIELNRRGPARPGWDAWGNEATEGSDTP